MAFLKMFLTVQEYYFLFIILFWFRYFTLDINNSLIRFKTNMFLKKRDNWVSPLSQFSSFEKKMAEACLLFLLFVVHFDHHHSSDLTRCVRKQPLFSQKNLVSSWHCYETIELNIFECVCVCYTCGACMYVPMRVCTQRSGKTLDILLYHCSSLYFKTDPQQEWSKGGN